MSTSDLFIVSDTHISSSWDHIQKVIPQHIPFLNPNHWLKEMVALMQKNQILIMNGDLVDYYFSDYENYSEERTNWQLLDKILDPCQAKIYFNIGNHDYRKIPYNYRFFSLTHWNIPRNVQKKYAQKIGHHKFRRLREIDSISVNLPQFNPLQNYPFKRNYSVNNGNQTLIFLDTGPDAFNQKKYYLHPLQFISMVKDKYCVGLFPDQIEFLQSQLSQSPALEIFIFIHCPPFYFNKPIQNEKLLENRQGLYLQNNTLTTRFIENNASFLKMLCLSPKNIFLIYSHCHDDNQYLIDKGSLILRKVSIADINDKRHSAQNIKILSTLALGGFEVDGEKNRKIGYLKVTSREIGYHIFKDYKNT